MIDGSLQLDLDSSEFLSEIRAEQTGLPMFENRSFLSNPLSGNPSTR